MEQGLSKKLKGSDGLPMPVGGDTSKSTAGETVLNASHTQRLQHDISLKDGSSGNAGAENAERTDGAESKETGDIDVEFDSSTTGKANETSTSISQNTTACVNYTGYYGAPFENAGNNTACVVSAGDERQLKRERRKQANRESARKSRLRKQAEYEELVHRLDSLKMENDALKSELEQLNADLEKLRLENAALMVQLEVSGVAQKGETVSSSAEADSTVTTEKVLDKADNLSRNLNLDRNTLENPKSETKHNQLLESSSRTDTVTAR